LTGGANQEGEPKGGGLESKPAGGPGRKTQENAKEDEQEDEP